MSDKKPVYIVIDELSECIGNMIKKNKRDVRKFLQWFRSMRQRTIEDLRFIVGGSVSFDRVVRGINGLSWINDFERVPIGGFSREDALEFIKKGLNDFYIKVDGENIRFQSKVLRDWWRLYG